MDAWPGPESPAEPDQELTGHGLFFEPRMFHIQGVDEPYLPHTNNTIHGSSLLR